MSIRVRSQIVVNASQDADEKTVHFSREDTSLTTVNAVYEVEESGQLVLAASEVNYAIPLGKVKTGALLYIESDQALVIRLDGEAVGHAIVPTTATKAKFFWHGSFTAAPIITNSAAVEATVSFLIAGSKT